MLSARALHPALQRPSAGPHLPELVGAHIDADVPMTLPERGETRWPIVTVTDELFSTCGKIGLGLSTGQDRDLVSGGHERLDNMQPDKACPTKNQNVHDLQ